MALNNEKIVINDFIVDCLALLIDEDVEIYRKQAALLLLRYYLPKFFVRQLKRFFCEQILRFLFVHLFLALCSLHSINNLDMNGTFLFLLKKSFHILCCNPHQYTTQNCHQHISLQDVLFLCQKQKYKG